MKLPSLTNESTWVWSEDPALDSVPIDPPKDATKAQRKKHEEDRKEWLRKLRVARDTGRYEPVTKPGHKVAEFNLRIVPTVAWNKLRDVSGGELNSAFVMAVRLALVSVANLEDAEGKPHKVEHRHEDGYGRIVTEETLNLLDAFSRWARNDGPNLAKSSDLIVEMGAYVMERQSGIRPLSQSA